MCSNNLAINPMIYQLIKQFINYLNNFLINQTIYQSIKQFINYSNNFSINQTLLTKLFLNSQSNYELFRQFID